MVRVIKKMQRIAILMTICTVLAGCMAGCSIEDPTEDKLKDVEFTVVGEEEQPETLKEIIAENRRMHFKSAIRLEVNCT